MTAAPNRLDDLRIHRQPGEGRRSRTWLWAGALTVGAAALGGWWLAAGRAPEVATAAAREVAGGPPAAVLNASGYVTARRQATVSSKVTGKLVEVLVEEGMEVREGEVLARLDDSIARAQLSLAESELEAARRALSEIEVRRAEARLNLARMRQLAAERVASQAELDAAQAEVDSLEARLDHARQGVEVAERLVALRRQELDDTVIRAPFSGVAISKDAQPGEMVSPVSAGGGFTRTGISTLVDMSSLEIEVDVSESYIDRVQSGQRVEATLDAYPGWRIPARVITTIPAADRQKATVQVRIAFEELDPRLLPDMGVKVAFLGEEDAEAPRSRVLVPRGAVREEGGTEVVFVVRGGRAERRVVTTGRTVGAEVEVLGGLAPGERVVVEGGGSLEDGDRVRVRGG